MFLLFARIRLKCAGANRRLPARTCRHDPLTSLQGFLDINGVRGRSGGARNRREAGGVRLRPVPGRRAAARAARAVMPVHLPHAFGLVGIVVFGVVSMPTSLDI